MDADSIAHALSPYQDGFPQHPALPPGTVLGTTNAALAGEVLPDEIAARVAQGDFTIEVAATKNYPLQPGYIDATVGGAVAVGLDGHGNLTGYTAGLPFPCISANEHDAGLKIAWNLRYRSLGGDSEALRVGWTTLNGAEVEDTQDMLTWRLRLSHRTTLEPSTLEPNPLDLFEVSVNEILSPPRLQGWLSANYRYNDPLKTDDIWVYTPRQVKALRTDYRNEDGYGYNGMVHSQQWRYLGVRDILSGVGLPTSIPTFGGHNGWYPTTPCQLRHTYVVEALAKDPDHHYPRRVFYIDAQLWMPVYTVGFDKSGGCFKLVFHLYGDPAHNPSVSDSHTGPINLGGCAIDYARNHATLLPNTEQQFNGPVEKHAIIQAALAGKAPVDAVLTPREDFQWIAIGHTADVVEIISNRLYRSGLPSQKVLDDGGIDVVVNLSGRNPTDLQRTAASGRMFVYWPIEDDEPPDHAMLNGLCHWLSMLLRTTDKKILVHCVASVNRSNLVIGRVLHDYLGLGGEPLIRYLEERSEGYAILTNRFFRNHLMQLPNNSDRCE